jgi:hypothetical protein
MKRAGILVGRMTSVPTGAGMARMAQSPTGVLAVVYVDASGNVVWTKSTDGGMSWDAPTAVFTGTTGQLATWYDRDSGIAQDLLHCAYTNTAVSDVLYRNIDIVTGSMSTETTVFAGASFSNNVPTLDITRARGGNLVCVGAIDGGVETFAVRSTSVGASWSSINSPMEGATNDFVILAPGWSTDSQDVMCLFWDASASEVSVKYYSNNANTWTEVSPAISTGMVAGNPITVGYPHWALAVDLPRRWNVLVAWSGIDTANADLKCWTVAGDASAPLVAAKTNVVTDGVDDQGLAALSIDDSGRWWAFYFGKTDGTETAVSEWNAYSKVSSDEGLTWQSEIQVTDHAGQVHWTGSWMHFVGVPPLAYSFAARALVASVCVDAVGKSVGVRWQEAVT